MKKSLIAVAVAAALPAAAIAQSNVQMYGIVDVYIAQQDDDRSGTGESQLAVESGGQSTSRWGVKGSEDLGGGLSGVFQLESALGVDDGSGFDQFVRRSYVGLKGGFGQVNLGRDYTPMFWTVIDNDQGGMAHSIADFLLGFSTRASNGVHYEGNFGSLQLNALWAASEAAGADDVLGVGIGYDGGAWGVNAAYHDESGNKIMHVGAEVKFGGFGLGFNYVDPDAADDPSLALSATLGVGASGNILLNYIDRDRAGVPGESMFQLMYRHNLSKRTNWYAGFLDFDAGGTELRAGVRHRF